MSVGTEVSQGAKDALGSAAEFFTHLSELLNDVLLENVAKHYQTVADAVYPIVAAAVLFYIIYAAIGLFYGRENGKSIFDMLFRIVVISAIAFNWSYIYRYIADPLLNGVPELIGKMFGTDSDVLIVDMVGNLFGQVKQSIDSFDSGMDIGAALIVSLMSFANFCAAAVMLLYYFYIVISSKLMVAMLLVLAPIFISFLMFKATRSYFFNWVNYMLTPLMTLIVLNLIVAFIGSLVTTAVEHYYSEGLTVTITAAFVGLIVSGFMILFMKEAGSIASNLVSQGFNISNNVAGKAKQATTENAGKAGSYAAGKVASIKSRFSKNKGE